MESDDYGFSPGASIEVFRYRIPIQIRNAMGRFCDQPRSQILSTMHRPRQTSKYEFMVGRTGRPRADTAGSDRDVGKLLDQIAAGFLGSGVTLKSCWDGAQLGRQVPKDLRTRSATISKAYIITEGLLSGGDGHTMGLAPKESAQHCLRCSQQPDHDSH